jgi:hypothetical protein
MDIQKHRLSKSDLDSRYICYQYMVPNKRIAGSISPSTYRRIQCYWLILDLNSKHLTVTRHGYSHGF